jgi:hypothetical protein
MTNAHIRQNPALRYPRRAPCGVRIPLIGRFGKPSVFNSLYSSRMRMEIVAFNYIRVSVGYHF